MYSVELDFFDLLHRTKTSGHGSRFRLSLIVHYSGTWFHVRTCSSAHQSHHTPKAMYEFRYWILACRVGSEAQGEEIELYHGRVYQTAS